MKRILLIMVLFVTTISFGDNVPPVQACTCTDPHVEWLLEDYDIVVRAQILETDARQRNYILDVEQYLAGTHGNRYLTVFHSTRAEERKVDEYQETCGVPIGRRVWSGQRSIYFLDRQMDGTYMAYEFCRQNFAFDTPDSTVRIYTNKNERREEIEVTEAELMALIEEESGQGPSEPIDDFFPLPAPLLIMTTENTLYRLPIDGAAPVKIAEEVDRTLVGGNRMGVISNGQLLMDGEVRECHTEQCAEISPDGFFTAYFIDESHVSFFDPQGIIFKDDDPVTGTHLQIDPTGHYIAAWGTDGLHIVTVGIEYLGDDFLAPQTIEIGLIADEQVNQLVWAEDGQSLAYVNKDGLWVLNIHTPEMPEFLLDNDVPIKLHGYSGLGNYIQLTQGDETFYLNIQNEQQLLGLLSPDERYVIVESRNGFDVCITVTMHCESFMSTVPPREWLNNHDVLFEFERGDWSEYSIYRMPADARIWDPYIIEETADDVIWWGLGARKVAYEPQSRWLAFLHIEPQLTVGYLFSTETARHAIVVELTDQVDGEIVDIEWMPPIFASE